MKHLDRLRAGVIAAWIGPALLPSVTAAQDYPTRTIRIISPVPAGGLSDIAMRPMAIELSQRRARVALGATLVVIYSTLGTVRPVVDWLRERALINAGLEPDLTSPEQFALHLAAISEQTAAQAKRLDVKPE